MKNWIYEFFIIIKNYIKTFPQKTFNSTKDNLINTKHFIKNFNYTELKIKVKQFIKRPLLPIILYKMLLRSFFYWYSIAQGLFIVIVLIFDFFSKLNDYMNNSVSTSNILYILILMVPYAMWKTMPIAIMFGVIMSLASFYQSNELIAIFSSGISIYKFVVPLIIFNIILSIFMIFADSFIVIPTYRYRENLYESLTKKNKTEGNNITIRGEKNYFWNVQNFVSSKNMLQNIIVFKVNDDYKVISRIDASSAVYTKDGWLFSTGIIRTWDNTGDLVNEEKFHKKVLSDLEEKPVVFKNVFKKSDYDIEKMTIFEARDRIKLLSKLNVDCNKEKTDYYKKFAFPFTLLVVCLFAIGVSTVSQRNIIILSLFFSIGLAILYYVLQMIIDVLAANGRMIPFIGAWVSIIIFLPIAIHLVKKAKT